MMAISHWEAEGLRLTSTERYTKLAPDFVPNDDNSGGALCGLTLVSVCVSARNYGVRWA